MLEALINDTYPELALAAVRDRLREQELLERDAARRATRRTARRAARHERVARWLGRVDVGHPVHREPPQPTEGHPSR